MQKLTGAAITIKPSDTSVAASAIAITPKTIVMHRSVSLDTHMLRGETCFGATSMAGETDDGCLKRCEETPIHDAKCGDQANLYLTGIDHQGGFDHTTPHPIRVFG